MELLFQRTQDTLTPCSSNISTSTIAKKYSYRNREVNGSPRVTTQKIREQTLILTWLIIGDRSRSSMAILI